jgi:hypothetical protein
MSTICKLDPEVRRRRTARATLLRHPPKHKDRALLIAVMSELALIAANPRLTGSMKHELFERGAEQLR